MSDLDGLMWGVAFVALVYALIASCCGHPFIALEVAACALLTLIVRVLQLRQNRRRQRHRDRTRDAEGLRQRADEQHAAWLRGDDHFATHGRARTLGETVQWFVERDQVDAATRHDLGQVVQAVAQANVSANERKRLVDFLAGQASRFPGDGGDFESLVSRAREQCERQLAREREAEVRRRGFDSGSNGFEELRRQIVKETQRRALELRIKHVHRRTGELWAKEPTDHSGQVFEASKAIVAQYHALAQQRDQREGGRCQDRRSQSVGGRPPSPVPVDWDALGPKGNTGPEGLALDVDHRAWLERLGTFHETASAEPCGVDPWTDQKAR